MLRDRLSHWYGEIASSTLYRSFLLVYYHTVSIFLSGIFDYHPPDLWPQPTPALSRPEIHDSVNYILDHVPLALKSTNLSPILFIVPLRVAGARVWTSAQATRIIDAYALITARGFPVVATVTDDLRSLWSRRGFAN